MASFKEKFAAERKAQGAGGEFTWNGKSYSTNIAGETGKKKKSKVTSTEDLVKMANDALNKASAEAGGFTSIPRPPPSRRTKPEDMPTSEGIRVPKASDITVTELPYKDTSLAGQARRLDKLKSEAADQTNRSKVNQGAKELMTGRKGAAAQYKQGGVVKMKKGGAFTTSEGLKGLALRVGNQKAIESLKQRRSYDDKGTSGRDFAAKQDNARMDSLTATHNRSKDLIERYGTDAPKARGFMAYEGQSGTTKANPEAYKPRMSPGMPKSMDEKYRSEGDVTRRKSGGMIKEGSAKDMREDKMKAKKAGMSMKTWEKSAADKKHDAPKKMAGGVVKKAGGGSMRGAGCAVRGKGFSGSY